MTIDFYSDVFSDSGFVFDLEFIINNPIPNNKPIAVVNARKYIDEEIIIAITKAMMTIPRNIFIV